MIDNILTTISLFGNELLDSGAFLELISRFAVNLLFAFIVIRLIYYKATRNTEFLFSIFLVNVTVFFICILLGGVKVKMGFAFGLFAIFSILRYRTEAIPIKAMTFLFIAITIAVINSLTSNKISIAEIMFANIAITILSYLLEKIWLNKRTISKRVTYEKIDLIVPGKREELIADLEKRTGLEITDIEIISIDFLRDVANINVFYNQSDKSIDTIIEESAR